MRTLTMIALSVSVLAGCKAIDAMDNTETMRKDLAAMKATMGTMKDTTGDMAGTTIQMRETTDELKRKASIGEGLKLIADPENTKEYAPPQANLVAGAKLVAENMTNEEVIDFLYAKINEFDRTVPNEAEFDRRLVGGYSARYVADFNRHKQVQVVTLQAIAAQIPQSETTLCSKTNESGASVQVPCLRATASLEAILRQQFSAGGGARVDTAYALLMLRAMFFESFFLNNGVLNASKKLDTMGKAQKAFTYLKGLQFIVSLPSPDMLKYDEDKVFKLENVKFQHEGTAFLPVVNPAKLLPGDADYAAKCPAGEQSPEADCKPTLGDAPSLNAQLDPGMARPWWKRFLRKIEKELPGEFKNGSSRHARDVAVMKEAAGRNSADR